MELNLPPMAETCCVSGEPFVEDERVVSVLARPDGGEAVERFDLRVAALDGFSPAGRVACRWTHVYTPKHRMENPERAMKLTAENIFLTLADPSAEISEDEERLVRFLALMLERKRILRPKGVNAAGTHNVYEHAGTKLRFEVPAGELSPEFFMAVQEQLSVLGGEPKSDAAAKAAPTVGKYGAA